MVEFMNAVPQSNGDVPSVLDDDDDVVDLIHTIVRAADGRKADDIVALNVRSSTSLCSAMILVSGNSRPQNQAICKAIQESVQQLQRQQREPQRHVLPEGTADSGWIVLDYGSVMVHIMTPKSRLYYNIEGQWAVDQGGTYVDLSRVLLAATVPNRSVATTHQQQQQEQDPFWS